MDEYAKVPTVIKNKVRWVGLHEDENGILVPIDIKSGRLASCEEEGHWGSFNEAVRAFDEDYDNCIDAIGYVLAEDEYAIEIMDCISDRKLIKTARDFVTSLESYYERGIKKTSIQILINANMPVIEDNYYIEHPSDGIKIIGAGNVIPITGKRGTKKYVDIVDCTDKIKAILDKHMLKPSHDTAGKSEEFVIDEIKLSLNQEKHIEVLSIDRLIGFPQQPFNTYDGDNLEKMVNSIKTHGVLVPITVRPHPTQEGMYEIICGHNRVRSSKEAGLVSVPAIIETMDDDTAILIMIETNFKQRHDLTFSEKARAYKLKNEVYKRQGKRNDLYGEDTLVDKFVHKSKEKTKTSDIIGSDNNKSGRTVRRYIRLTELINEFMLSVDDGKLSFNTAVDISYLSKKEQKILYDLLKDKNIKITQKHAVALKRAKDDDVRLNKEKILEIITAIDSQKSTKISTIKLPYDKISHFFEGEELSEEEISAKIMEALNVAFPKE